MPGDEARAHGRRVSDHLASLIADGSIDFARYMHEALYAPGLGYYSAGATKLGAAGDFITAPEISSLFGRALARPCRDVLSRIGGDVLELGAGSGRLAVDVLRELERLDCLPGRYFILEVSGDLRARQHDRLVECVPHLLDRVEWLDTLPDTPLEGVVLANEVLDALPVHCLQIDSTGIRERRVGYAGGRLAWQPAAAPAPLRQAFERLLAELPQQPVPPYRTEINPGLAAWLGAVADSFSRGVMLFVDYGYPRAEYYHPQRDSGTLICHYRHRAHDDPFLYPGLQDISASVDFTRLAEAALACDLEVAGFTSQAHFLIGCGIDELLAESAAEQARYLQRAGEVKRLTLPGEMGERFKVMALSRGFDAPLAALQRADFRHRL